MRTFEDVTAIVPVVTETESLRTTVRTLVEQNSGVLKEILLVTCSRTTEKSRDACEEMLRIFPNFVKLYEQRRPYLGNAIREAFEQAEASHVVMMSSDLETDPETFPLLVEAAQRQPEAVITASRWLNGKSFTGYGLIRWIANFAFQSLGRVVFATKASDLTFGYRLFPANLVKGILWEGERHEFILETILKPIRLGVPIVEVPTRWSPRPDGESQNSLWLQAMYARTLLRCRVTKTSRFDVRHSSYIS